MRVKLNFSVDVDINGWNYNFASEDNAAEVRKLLPNVAQRIVQECLDDMAEDYQKANEEIPIDEYLRRG